MLTQRQRQLFDFIRAEIGREGIAPSHLEMQLHLGAPSKSNVVWLLDQLVDRGYIRRLPYRSRALDIVDRAAPAERVAYFRFNSATKSLEPLSP